MEVYPGPVKTRFFERARVKTPLTAISAEKVTEAILRVVEKREEDSVRAIPPTSAFGLWSPTFQGLTD